MPIEDALVYAERVLKDESIETLRHAQICWHSSIPLYANGGKIPDPPRLKE